MDLSIVIINWNTRELTLECLHSVYANLGVLKAEVLLVDNASSDGSADAIAREFPQVHLIRNTENRGFAAANNQAMANAVGKYVLLLNSDTLVLGDVLTRSVRYMDEHAQVGVLGCRVLNTDRSVQLTCFQFPSIPNLVLKTTGLFRLKWPKWLGREHLRGWQRDCERDVDVVTGCFMLVRAAAIERVGMMDETFFFCGEETDWCRRFKRAAWAVRFAPVGEIIHHGGASGCRLDHRRDLLLSQGLVRFHRNKGGRLQAVAAFAILWLFNVSRLGLWTVAAIVRQNEAWITRSRHFRKVVSGFEQAWPSGQRA